MTNAPVEAKVKWATYAALAVGGVIAVLNGVVADSALLGSLPAWLQAAVTLIVPPLVTFLTSWQARHTPRGPSAAA